MEYRALFLLGDDMNFWKTEEWTNYLLHDGTGYIDRSFFMGEYIPLLQVGQEFYSPYLPDRKDVLQRVSELAKEHGIKRIQADNQIKGYLNISGYTCVVDTFDIKPTKGHKAAIKIGHKNLKYKIITRLSETNRFRRDYFDIAGKQTRPNMAFFYLWKWIGMGYGTLLKAISGDETVGYIYILHYENEAYYFMSGTFEKFKELNVSHYLQSVAFEILKQKNIHHYEMGEQVYNSLFCQPTEKERNISLFKRGFGGDIAVKPRSECFFDHDYMKQTYENRIIKYLEAEHENINRLSKT
jgi:hypothetical protein